MAALVSPNTHPYDLTVVWPALALVATRDRVVATGLTVFVASWIVISAARRWILTSGLAGLAARILQASRVTPTDTE